MTDQQGRQKASTEPRHRLAALRALLRRRKQPPTLRFQLILIVNGAMAILLVVLLTLDYRRELSVRLEQKRVALEAEAKTMLPAISRLRSGGVEGIQKYLDAVCRRMHADESPGHHIAVDTGAEVIQATAHARASIEMFQAMQQTVSAQQSAGLGARDIVVGSAGLGGVRVYVSEDAAALRYDVFGQILGRLIGLLTLGIVASIITSLVLLRMVAVPISRFVATVASIAEGDFQVHVSGANSRELAALAVAIQSMAKRLQSSSEQRRAEMDKAREIQEHLLPASAAIPGVMLAARYRPATDVAGDYYDVLELTDGSWVLCVADVCGHGIPAAMSAATLKALLLNAVEHHLDPAEMLKFINSRFMVISPPAVFVSMLLVRWEPARGMLQFASAGHEPGLLLRADGTVAELGATGYLLGIDADASWDTEQLFSRGGDRLVATTDGVAEAWSPQGELFGRERLQALVQNSAGESVEEMVQRLDAALLDHQGNSPAMDDTTILAADFAVETASSVASGEPSESQILPGGRHRRESSIEQGMLH